MTAHPRDMTIPPIKPDGLVALLDNIRAGARGESISIGDMLALIGRQSFAAALLLIGLLIVSPLSGIPGLPAFMAIVVFLIAIQAILGRRRLWLPGFLTRRSVRTDRLMRALDMVEGPTRWIDGHRSGRLSLLALWPLSSLGYLVIIAVALTWPPMSLIPFSATLTGIGLSLVAAGLMVRDGIFIVVGAVYLTLIYGAGAAIVTGVF